MARTKQTVATKKTRKLHPKKALKKKRRFRPGTVAKREITRLQKSNKLLIPKKPFVQLVREIAADFRPGVRFAKDALTALQEIAEAHMTNFFEQTTLITKARNARTLRLVDMKAVMNTKKVSQGGMGAFVRFDPEHKAIEEAWRKEKQSKKPTIAIVTVKDSKKMKKSKKKAKAVTPKPKEKKKAKTTSDTKKKTPLKSKLSEQSSSSEAPDRDSIDKSEQTEPSENTTDSDESTPMDRPDDTPAVTSTSDNESQPPKPTEPTEPTEEMDVVDDESS